MLIILSKKTNWLNNWLIISNTYICELNDEEKLDCKEAGLIVQHIVHK